MVPQYKKIYRSSGNILNELYVNNKYPISDRLLKLKIISNENYYAVIYYLSLLSFLAIFTLSINILFGFAILNPTYTIL
jgi:hypothetical protein